MGYQIRQFVQDEVSSDIMGEEIYIYIYQYVAPVKGDRFQIEWIVMDEKTDNNNNNSVYTKEILLQRKSINGLLPK